MKMRAAAFSVAVVQWEVALGHPPVAAASNLPEGVHIPALVEPVLSAEHTALVHRALTEARKCHLVHGSVASQSGPAEAFPDVDVAEAHQAHVVAVADRHIALDLEEGVVAPADLGPTVSPLAQEDIRRPLDSAETKPAQDTSLRRVRRVL